MTQLALFPILPGTRVQRTVKHRDGPTTVHPGCVTAATDTWLYYACTTPGCACRLPVTDRAHSSHAVPTPRP